MPLITPAAFSARSAHYEWAMSPAGDPMPERLARELATLGASELAGLAKVLPKLSSPEDVLARARAWAAAASALASGSRPREIPMWSPELDPAVAWVQDWTRSAAGSGRSGPDPKRALGWERAAPRMVEASDELCSALGFRLPAPELRMSARFGHAADAALGRSSSSAAEMESAAVVWLRLGARPAEGLDACFERAVDARRGWRLAAELAALGAKAPERLAKAVNACVSAALSQDRGRPGSPSAGERAAAAEALLRASGKSLSRLGAAKTDSMLASAAFEWGGGELARELRAAGADFGGASRGGAVGALAKIVSRSSNVPAEAPGALEALREVLADAAEPAFGPGWAELCRALGAKHWRGSAEPEPWAEALAAWSQAGRWPASEIESLGRAWPELGAQSALLAAVESCALREELGGSAELSPKGARGPRL